MFKLLKDITTGKDNETHEVIRVFMLVIIVICVLAFVVGTVMEVWHALESGQWDLQSYFQAIATFVLGINTLLVSGAGAIKLKTQNEPQTEARI